MSREQTAALTEETCLNDGLDTISTENGTHITDQLLTFTLDRQSYGVPIAQVEQISPPPQISDESAGGRYLTGIARVEGEGGERLILCLDLSRVLLQDEFAALARTGEKEA